MTWDNATVQRDFTGSMVGALLGGGQGRDVYRFKWDERYVIKFESNRGSFQNQFEWEVWNRISETKWAEWFAPCKWISDSGTVLIMERTVACPVKDYPKRMPAFFTDFKYQNYGNLNGKFVCHDYGTCLLMEEGMTDRTKKAEWWGDLP